MATILLFYSIAKKIKDINSASLSTHNIQHANNIKGTDFRDYDGGAGGTGNDVVVTRGSVRSTRGLGPTMTARGQSIGISIGMLPQTLIMSITVQKTSKYYTTEFDLEEGF